MNKTKLFKLLLNLQTSANKGLSLIELLLGLLISGIVLTAAASGFTNLLTSDQDVESKTVRSTTLSRALAYMQIDMKEARTITREVATPTGNCDSDDVDSASCLVLTYPNGSEIDGNTCDVNPPQIYYGYQDISTPPGTSQIWLKPGILRRKVFCDTGTTPKWNVIADGLISVNEGNPRASFADDTAFCAQGDANWTSGNLFGDDGSGKGGFRFCLNDTTATNRLVRVFLYGHIVGGNTNNTIPVNTITFARSN